MYIGLLSKRMSGVSPDIVDRSHKDFLPLVHVVLRHAARTAVMLCSINALCALLVGILPSVTADGAKLHTFI